MANKRVKIITCPSKLRLVKEIKEITDKGLSESKNIVDSVLPDSLKCGILLLNESSITPEQWEQIAKNCQDLKWEYV